MTDIDRLALQISGDGQILGIHTLAVAAKHELVARYMSFGNVVSVDLETGAIEMLEGFTTNEAAALAFWDAVRQLAPNLCKE